MACFLMYLLVGTTITLFYLPTEDAIKFYRESRAAAEKRYGQMRLAERSSASPTTVSASPATSASGAPSVGVPSSSPTAPATVPPTTVPSTTVLPTTVPIATAAVTTVLQTTVLPTTVPTTTAAVTTVLPTTVLPTTGPTTTAPVTTVLQTTVLPTTGPTTTAPVTTVLPTTVLPTTGPTTTAPVTTVLPTTVLPTTGPTTTASVTTVLPTTVLPTTGPTTTAPVTTVLQTTVLPTTGPTTTAPVTTVLPTTVLPTTGPTTTAPVTTVLPTTQLPTTVPATTAKVATVQPTTKPTTLKNPTTSALICSSHCRVCTKNGAGNCDTCSSGFYLLWDNKTCTNCNPATAGQSYNHIVTRCMWNAATAKYPAKLIAHLPVPDVIIHHTMTATCSGIVGCSTVVFDIQALMMGPTHDMFKPDISYNFLVSPDGFIFEGVGWGVAGYATQQASVNAVSVNIAIVGDYHQYAPSQVAVTAVQNLIAFGVNLGYISKTYIPHSHFDVDCTKCPGNPLIEIIRTWPRSPSEPQSASKTCTLNTRTWLHPMR